MKMNLQAEIIFIYETGKKELGTGHCQGYDFLSLT